MTNKYHFLDKLEDGTYVFFGRHFKYKPYFFVSNRGLAVAILLAFAKIIESNNLVSSHLMFTILMVIIFVAITYLAVTDWLRYSKI